MNEIDPAPLPRAFGGLMSAWQVLSWISFRELRPTTPEEDFNSLVIRWGSDSPPQVLEALRARAGVSPYCLLKAVTKYNDLERRSSSVCSSAGPSILRRIVVEFRQREHRRVRLAELVTMLEKEIEILSDKKRRLSSARDELTEALVTSRITAFGRSDWSSKEGIPAPLHAISADFFREMLVTDRGTVIRKVPPNWTMKPDALGNMVVVDTKNSPVFIEVQFHTAEVLKHWPEKIREVVQPPSAGHSPVRGASRGGAPQRHDWEQFWIEVVLYAADNGVEEEFRVEMQRHMEKWTGEKWDDPPDEATIRKRLSKLFQANRNARN